MSFTRFHDPFSQPETVENYRNSAIDLAERVANRSVCYVSVTESNGAPVSDTNPLPVDILGATITAGNLNVQLSDQGVSPDVTRIGDGTNQLVMDATGAIGVNLKVAGNPVTLGNPVPVSAAQSGAWATKITDGVDTVGISTVGGQKALKVDVVQTVGGGGGGGGTGIAYTDENAFTEGTSQYTPIGGEFKDTGTDLTDGQGGVAKVTAKRALHINLRSTAGTELATAGAPLRVDPTGTTPQPASQSGAWSVTANIGTTGGLALDATLTGGTAKTQVTDGVDTVGISTIGGQKALKVDVLQMVAGAHGTAAMDEAAFTEGVSQYTPIGGEFKDTGTDLTDGQAGVAKVTAKRALHTNLRSATGTELATAGAPLRVDPTGTTPQPATQSGTWNIGTVTSITNPVTVTGTVTADIGTTGGLALDATLTGGTAKTIIRGGSKGATTPADITSTAEGADHQGVDVQLYHGGAAIDPRSIRALTNADVVSAEVTKWLGSTAPTVGQKTMANSIPVTIASDQSIAIVARDRDIFGASVGTTRLNQVEVKLDTGTLSSLVTLTNTGTGSAAIANGHAVFQTGVGVTSSSKGVSLANTSYRPGNETYVEFTAAFTTPTSASSYQRIGLYDASNGFFVGYEGLSFGITKRSAGVDVNVPQASFNGDPLDGSAGSAFTRGGVLEAVDKTLSNLFRIRFGWFGSAPIIFEILSPDGAWIVFHTIRQPNTSTLPSVQNPDLPITLDVSKTASDATNLQITTACWSAGTTGEVITLTSTLTDQSLARLSRSALVGRSTAGGGTWIDVLVDPAGSLTSDITSWGGTATSLGQKTMASSVPVTLASNQSALPVSQSGTWDIGTVSTVTTVTSITNVVHVDDNAGSLTIDTSQLPSSLVGGRLDANVGAWLGSTAPTVGQKTMANSLPVSLASDQSALAVSQSGSWTVTAAGSKTNNSAAPGANNLGALVAVANAAAPTWSEGNEVLLSVDLAGNQRVLATNGAGAAAVNIQDGGNSITVDGTVTANQGGAPWSVSQSGTWNIGTVTSITNVVHVDDNAGSLTIDNVNLDAALSTLATSANQTNGTQKSIVRGGAKGATIAADVTSTPSGANHQILDVAVYDASGNQITTFGGGQQYADGTARGTATGTLMMVDDGVNIQSASGDSNGRLNVNVRGDKTNNNAAPGATNVGALVAIANAAAPTWSEGNEVLLSTDLSGRLRSDVSSWLGSTAPSVGQKTMTNSIPVVIASDQAAFPVSQSGTWNIGTVSTVTSITNVVHVDDNAGSLTVDNNGTFAVQAAQSGNWNVRLTDGTNSITKTFDLDSGAGTEWNIGVNLRLTANGGSIEAIGQKAMASSIPVAIASDQSTLAVSTKTALTPSAPASASVGIASGTAVAANASRKGLTLVNTSNKTISIAFGANAAVLGSGISLLANGGTFVMDEYTFTTQAVNAIAGGAASNLSIQEFS